MTPTVSHTVVTAEGAQPSRAILFLHGIFGAGANWRSFARRFVTARPDWCAVLVDLRMHGASQSFAAPHTLAATAADLDALDAVLPVPVRGVVGHSFGGKVALAYIAKRADTLDEAWILDSSPGSRIDARGSETTLQVLDTLSALPDRRFASRELFIQHLAHAGITRGIGQWLAMNLRPVDNAYEFKLDLAAIRALLDDYFAVDLWPVIEKSPVSLATHVVLGGRSRVFSDADRARVETLAAQRPQHVFLHVLEDAGHWVHVDDPDGLLALMTARWG
jgi:pimeloyl-ACP methyl ester carboxylesterase